MNYDDLYKQTLSQYNEPDFAKKYADNTSDRVNKKLISKFLSLVPKGCKVLDVASAAGRDSAYMDNLGYKVTGIDLSQELIKIAREKYPDIKFVLGDFTLMPFDSGSFDAIWCNAAIVHMPSQNLVEKAVREFHRVLKPGGIIMISAKAKNAGDSSTMLKTDKLSNNKERFFRFQEKDEFTKLISKNGFKIIESKVYDEDGFGHKIKRDQKWVCVTAQKM